MGFSTGVSINAGTGEANDGTSLGAGEGVFVDKVGTDLRFKSLVAGTDISLVSDANTITINSTGGGTARNIQIGSPTPSNPPTNYTSSSYTLVTGLSMTFTKQVQNSYLNVKVIPDQRTFHTVTPSETSNAQQGYIIGFNTSGSFFEFFQAVFVDGVLQMRSKWKNQNDAGSTQTDEEEYRTSLEFNIMNGVTAGSYDVDIRTKMVTGTASQFYNMVLVVEEVFL